MLIRGRWESKNGRREARRSISCSLLLTLYLPQLVLLIFHIVNEDFLVSAHVLHYEVVGGVGQVATTCVAVGGGRPGFASWSCRCLPIGTRLLARLALVEKLRGSAGA